MSEDILHFFQRETGTDWRISGRDAELLAELRKALRAWLPAFETGAEVVVLGKALEDLEHLQADGRVPGSYEIEISRRDAAGCGLSAYLAISCREISLGVIEYVPGPNGGSDHGAVLDRNGRPVYLCLDASGSFDQPMFEVWWQRAMDLAPTDLAKITEKATISREGE
ncbi:MAG: hypothetical protein U1E06_16875 [Tabrizicola sp.]|uniref:hypothetical protein n=1 Tax=Tabrizicola sp. TaxID=2005166 RepID=UPI0027340065|nr:hypothetical protein [Tabrizicola sp.]MDP3264397.1 hypothetical protein [Tabrizicola sp.]MDP3646443.1 hypothetical protein [Paracoccaceae bacterium]MDZ4068495.1 hypothetical protein [Tabrizicola sp.]